MSLEWCVMRSHQNTIHTGGWAKKKQKKTKNNNPKTLPFRVTCRLNTKTKTRLFCAAQREPCSDVRQMSRETGCTRLSGAAEIPLAVPLINNTSWKLSGMTRTIAAPNLVQSQRLGLWLDIIRPCLSPFPADLSNWTAESMSKKLWSRTISNKDGTRLPEIAQVIWRQYAGFFQVEIQQKRGSGCSVPTPALPGANSHWISGEPRGGEQTQTAPLLKMTLKMVAKYSRQIKGRLAETSHTTHSAILPSRHAGRAKRVLLLQHPLLKLFTFFFPHACTSWCHQSRPGHPTEIPIFTIPVTVGF